MIARSNPERANAAQEARPSDAEQRDKRNTYRRDSQL